MHPDETGIYHAILSGIIVLLMLVAFFIITIIRYQRKKVAFYSEKVREEFYYLDKERQRIAADLHDDLGSSLSAIKLRLQCIYSTDTENTAIIKHSELLLDQAMQRLRQVSFNLMPGVLQRRGLDEALRELIEVMTEKTNIIVNYNCVTELPVKRKALHIYRIMQEILNNIIKHASASVIDITMSNHKNKLLLQVRDNGKGFDQKMVTRSHSGSGLGNIASRADLLKAKVYLTTSRGEGTMYRIEIPV